MSIIRQRSDIPPLWHLDSQCFVKLVSEELADPTFGLKAGVMIGNSEVGMGSVSVEPFVYRKACTNDLVVNSEKAFRHAHVHFTLHEWTRRMAEGIGDAFLEASKALDAFLASRADPIQDPLALIRKLAEDRKTGATALNAKNFVRRVFLPAIKAAGIENFHWHDTRHTFASRLVMAGVDLRTVQELLGHHSYEITLRYTHLSPRHQLDAVQRLNATPTRTRTDTKPEEAPQIAANCAPETRKAPEKSGALRRAGDRGRTGDVQLGKLAFYH
jgi:hypothetical protein